MIYPILNGSLDCDEAELPKSASGVLKIGDQIFRLETLVIPNTHLRQRAIVEIFIGEDLKKRFRDNETLWNYLVHVQPNLLAWVFTYARREIVPV